MSRRFLRRCLAGAVVSAAACCVAAVAWASYGGTASVTRFEGWMASCKSLGFTLDGTFDAEGASGTFDHDYLNHPSSPAVQVARHGGKPGTFDFQAEDYPVAVVIVQTKSPPSGDDDEGAEDDPNRPWSNGGTIYTYSPAVLSDAGLEARDAKGKAQRRIKHIVFCPGATPTAVSVASFAARSGPDGLRLSWRSASEVGTLGYNVYRQTTAGKARLNARLILARGPSRGYALVARRAPGTYLLQEVRTSGARRWLARTTIPS